MDSSLFDGYSKALYSSWLQYRPDRLLVDCGEGCATSLGNNVYAIERVLLTHGHIDHISGLPSLLWARAAGMGANEKPLQIYYPRGDLFVADLRQYLERTRARLPFELEWTELDANSSFDLETGGRQPRRVQTFATEHIPGRLTLGYSICEKRRRLKPQFVSLDEAEIRARAAHENVMEEYDAKLVTFGGDGLALKPEDARDSEILFHEATILDASDRKHQLHATLDEALNVAHAAQVAALILNHVSGRYRAAEVREAILKSAAKLNFAGEIWCLRRDKLFAVWPEKQDVISA